MYVRFLERSVEIERCIVDLMEYVDGDSVVTAAITEQQLEAYLFILIPQIGCYQNDFWELLTQCTCMYTIYCANFT